MRPLRFAFVVGIAVGSLATAWVISTAGCGTIATVDARSDTVDEPYQADADATDDGQYNDIRDSRFWSSVDLKAFLSPGTGFANAGFDGRFVYWHALLWDAEGGVKSVFVRYDNQKPFEDVASWSQWALPSLMNGGAGPILFDGRYLYLGCTGGVKPREFRFDTHGQFGDASSLALSAVPGVDGGDGFILPSGSGAFDGRFVYRPDEGTANGLRTRRYDTQGDFTNYMFWEVGYSSSLAAAPAVFAPPYILFTPQSPTTGSVIAYDTRLPFEAVSSWTRYSPQNEAPNVPFAGLGTDGRFAYFVPQDLGPWRGNGVVLRHDLSAQLNESSSWATFSITQVEPLARSFPRASWDGRFFYFLVGNDGTNGAFVSRYDTSAAFTAPSSWSVFDITPLVPKTQQAPRWRGGVVFDGEFVYMAAYDAPLIMRFKARTPSKMPMGFSGVFY
jgi:hypothetical protein